MTTLEQALQPRAVFGATIKGGRLLLDDTPGWRAFMSKLPDMRVQLELRRERKTRNNAQLRRYFGRIIRVVRKILSRGRAVPLSKLQTHEVLCRAFIGEEETPLGPVRIETKTLTPAQFAKFCDLVEAHFATEYGAVFPEVGEAMDDEDVVEDLIGEANA